MHEPAHLEPGEAFLQADFMDVFSTGRRDPALRDRARPTIGSDRGFARSNLSRWAALLQDPKKRLFGHDCCLRLLAKESEKISLILEEHHYFL